MNRMKKILLATSEFLNNNRPAFLSGMALTLGLAIFAGVAVVGLAIIAPPVLPAIIGFSLFGVAPFALAAGLSFVAQTAIVAGAATVATALLGGLATATATGVSALYNSLAQRFSGSQKSPSHDGNQQSDLLIKSTENYSSEEEDSKDLERKNRIEKPGATGDRTNETSASVSHKDSNPTSSSTSEHGMFKPESPTRKGSDNDTNIEQNDILSTSPGNG